MTFQVWGSQFERLFEVNDLRREGKRTLEEIKTQVSCRHLTQVEQSSSPRFTRCFHLIKPSPNLPYFPWSLFPSPSLYLPLSFSLPLCNTAVLQSCWCDRSKYLHTQTHMLAHTRSVINQITLYSLWLLSLLLSSLLIVTLIAVLRLCSDSMSLSHSGFFFFFFFVPSISTLLTFYFSWPPWF